MLRAMYYHPEIADRCGYSVYPQVFHSPFALPQELSLVKLETRRQLPGIDYNVEEITRLVETLSQYSAEARDFLKNRKGDVVAWDTTYPPCDAVTLYTMLRHIKPKRYIEVGCGYSSSCSAPALRRNQSEGNACRATYIDPVPLAHLADVNLPGEFIKEKIQNIPLERFLELEAGDVLFIDTSHILKVQSDVEHELIRILPMLKPGVWLHFHDIFSPYDYPKEWLADNSPKRGASNEQYGLECLLSGGGDWKVILPVYLLWKDHHEVMATLIESDERPAAFWIKKIRQGAPT
jgi:predicted O-methyltransferase YrrM